MSFYHYKNWSYVLENCFLQYSWTLHAKEFTYTTRGRVVTPRDIEELVFDYSENPNNADIQECNSSKPNNIIIQKKIQDNRQVLRVVIDKNTRPWQIVTYYTASCAR